MSHLRCNLTKKQIESIIRAFRFIENMLHAEQGGLYPIVIRYRKLRTYFQTKLDESEKRRKEKKI